jgi:hypothetical protein
MLESVFDIPLFIAGPAIVGALCLYGLLGMWIFRRFILPRMGLQAADSDFNSTMLQAVMVFYGLAVALITVSVWQNYSEAGRVTSQEATAAAALYRDVSDYPEPIRNQLQTQLREYVNQIIHQAWPIQQHGQIPTGSLEIMNRFQVRLMSFEPATEGQKILHAETVGAYNRLIQAWRLRIDSVQARLPGVLWFIIVAGALISLSSSFFFRIDNAWLQSIQIALLAAFVGLVIFLIYAFDRPFRGELGLSSDSYQVVFDQLMKPKFKADAADAR